MAHARGRGYVGFGFGPIQTGLMLYEAVESGSFDRYAVAEVDQRLVDAVRSHGDSVTVNVAGRDGIRTKTLRGIRLYNPGVPADRAALVRAIHESQEMATAVPSVAVYSAGGDASIVSLLAEGADASLPRVLYAAENDNFAAEKLTEEVTTRRGRPLGTDLRVVNTVIGKMSGLLSTVEEMRALDAVPLVPGFDRCVLVEEFNRILISRHSIPGFVRGIRVFEEKDDLLPFEEAKLYGHNAIHALMGYLARLKGYPAMSDIRNDPRMMEVGRRAFLDESGPGLIHRHEGLHDPLFSPPGWKVYAEDLLQRMTNPWLHDVVIRITRDPRRKLGWTDRFVGAMRAALEAGIQPASLGLGAAAALSVAMAEEKSALTPRDYLLSLWGKDGRCDTAGHILEIILASMERLDEWRV